MKLNAQDQDRIFNFYQTAFHQYGDRDARSVRWTSKQGQETRFRVLANIAELGGNSVLDVGCGLGDLHKYFLLHNTEVNYTGIDIVPEFIVAAKQRFPDARFEHKDIFSINEQFDYVLASGSLSFKVADNENYYKEMIAKMYEVATIGVAFNLLDKRTHIDDDTYAAYDIDDIADYCSTFAKGVEIVTDYLPRDFTIYLFK